MKEWIKASRSPNGALVTVTVQDGNLTARWTEKTSLSSIEESVRVSRRQAKKILAQLRTASHG